MKGLLLKDLLGLKRYLRTIFLIVLFYIVLSVFMQSNSMIAGITAMIAVMIPTAAFGYDELANWDVYCLSLPVSRKDVVRSRYLLALLIMLAALLFSGVVTAAVSFFQSGGVKNEDLLSCAVVFEIGILINAVLLPLLYRFGAQKARFLASGALLAGVLVVILLYRVGRARIPFGAWGNLKFLLFLLPAVPVAGYLASYCLSCRIYEKKEF